MRRIALLVALLVAAGSCGYYSTSSRTAKDIKQIAIPYLRNETPEPDIENEITDKVIEGIVNDNTLKVVARDEAHAVLEGRIVEYRNVPFTFNRGSDASIQADQYRLVIGLRISLFNPEDNSYIWQDRSVKAHGDYYLDEGAQQNYENALKEVYREIVEGILSTMIEDW